MSYDYFLYSPTEQPVLKEDLKAELERQGWHVVFCKSGTKVEKLVPSDGPLENGTFLLACHADGDLPRFLEAVQQNNIEEMNKVLQDEGIEGTDFCGVWWSAFNMNDDYTPEMLAELTESYGDDFVDALRQTRTHYSLDVAYEDFHEFVARSIAELVGGVIEDPQQGTTEFIRAKG